MMQRQVSGFTIIELLAVILIVGLAVGLVTMNSGSGDNIKLRNQVRNFTNSTALLLDEAVLSDRVWGVDLYQDTDNQGYIRYGYRWLRFDTWLGWVPQTPRDFDQDILFSRDIQLMLILNDTEQDIEIKKPYKHPPKGEDQPPSSYHNTINGTVVYTAANSDQNVIRSPAEDNELKPDLYISPGGEMSTFKLVVTASDPEQSGELQMVVVGDMLGRIKLQESADEDF